MGRWEPWACSQAGILGWRESKLAWIPGMNRWPKMPPNPRLSWTMPMRSAELSSWTEFLKIPNRVARMDFSADPTGLQRDPKRAWEGCGMDLIDERLWVIGWLDYASWVCVMMSRDGSHKNLQCGGGQPTLQFILKKDNTTLIWQVRGSSEQEAHHSANRLHFRV